MDVGVILGVIEEALGLLNKFVPDQATRIANEIISLRGQWDEEYAKGSNRNDNNLDSIERRLRDIRELYVAAIKSAMAKN